VQSSAGEVAYTRPLKRLSCATKQYKISQITAPTCQRGWQPYAQNSLLYQAFFHHIPLTWKWNEQSKQEEKRNVMKHQMHSEDCSHCREVALENLQIHVNKRLQS